MSMSGGRGRGTKIERQRLGSLTMAAMGRPDSERRVRQRADHLPAWPTIYGDPRQWWVDGVTVPKSWCHIGFTMLVVLPLGV